MGINIGLDIGAISLKLAALGKPADRPVLEALGEAHPEFRLIALGECPLLLSDYRRISGSPIQSTYDLLRELYDVIPEDRVEGMRVTGSGSRNIAKVLGLFFENEFKAIARMVGTFYPEVRTIFELGGESSKYIRLEGGGIQDYDRSGECAAGTGSFLDQQALRMQYSVEEVGELVCTAGCAARIAGRCSVFAKSDMIHAQQKGYSPAEILRGLCDAVARNFKSSIVKGRPVATPAALIGAVSQNAGVVGALREAFSLTAEQLSFPRSTPGAGRSARQFWRRKSRGSGPSWRSTGCGSTIPTKACRIRIRSRRRTWCSCAIGCRCTFRRRASREFRRILGWTSGRCRRMWW